MLLQWKTFFHHRIGGLVKLKKHGERRAFLCLQVNHAQTQKTHEMPSRDYYGH